MTNKQFGIFPLSGNFEIQYAGSIDSRNNIESKNLLFEESTWLSTDNSIYIYNGMPVIVWNDQNIENNGLYILLNKNLYTIESSWLYIGKQKNSIFAGPKSSSTDSGVVGDMSITDDYVYICVSTGNVGNAIWKRIPLFATI